MKPPTCNGFLDQGARLCGRPAPETVGVLRYCPEHASQLRDLAVADLARQRDGLVERLREAAILLTVHGIVSEGQRKGIDQRIERAAERSGW